MSSESAPKIYIAAIVRTKLNVKEALHYTHYPLFTCIGVSTCKKISYHFHHAATTPAVFPASS